MRTLYRLVLIVGCFVAAAAIVVTAIALMTPPVLKFSAAVLGSCFVLALVHLEYGHIEREKQRAAAADNPASITRKTCIGGGRHVWTKRIDNKSWRCVTCGSITVDSNVVNV
jgi:hypothetical protein